MRKLVKALTPPILWTALSAAKRRIVRSTHVDMHPGAQSLDDYWDPKVAAILKT